MSGILCQEILAKFFSLIFYLQKLDLKYFTYLFLKT